MSIFKISLLNKINGDETPSFSSSLRSPTSRSLRKRTSNLSSNRISGDLKYKEAIDLLMISPHERAYEEVQLLAKLTCPMQYFQEMNRKSINQSERVHERCCAVLRYEFLRKGDVVFNAEEKPNKFYIIFSGSVNILIPKTETTFKRDMNKRNFKITKNLVERYTNKINKPKSLDEFGSTSDHEDEQNNKDDEFSSLSPSKLKNEIGKITELLGGIPLSDVNINCIEDLFIEGTLRFTYYTNLKEGNYFGELGLLRGKTRSATVICKEDCHFAVMMAEDYKNIVAVVERKKIYNKFEFFKKFLVKGIAYDNLAKLAYSFEKKKYGRGEYIFKEGDPGNEVFLIKKGEIQIHKILTEKSQKNKKLCSNNIEFNRRRIPLLETFNKKNQILITLLEGEFFGEDEIINNNNPNDTCIPRTYSAFVSSPKASVYVCTVQFFKKYIFERPNLLKKLKEKYFVKKELWEKQLSNCLNQRKDIYFKEKIVIHPKQDLPKIMNVFFDQMTEENKPKTNESLNNFSNNEPISIKKSVGDLKSKISEMLHHNVFKKEITKLKAKTREDEKFININDSEMLDLDEGNEKKSMNAGSNSKKSNSLENQIKFINKKYDQMIKDNKYHQIAECFNFKGEKEGGMSSRIQVYLKGKFRRHFNKSSTENDLKTYNNSHSVKKFNDSLMKSIKYIKNRDKLDMNSLKLSFLEENSQNQNDSSVNNKLFIKNNKQLVYLNRIDFSNSSFLEKSLKK